MKKEQRGLLIAIVATLCASSVPLASKVVLGYISSPLTLILRMLFAAVILFLIVKFLLKIKLQVSKKSLLVAFFGAMNFCFFILGIKFMPTVFTPVFYSSVPIQATLIAWILFRDKIGKIELIGIVAGFIGSFVIFSDDLINSTASDVELLGFIFMSLASMSIAVYGLLIDKLKKELPSVFSVTLQAVTFALVISFIIGIFYPDTFTLSRQIGTNFWLGILFLAVFGTVIQYVMYQKSIEIMGKSATVILFYLQPVIVVILSAIFLEEDISWVNYIIGMILILAGSSLNIGFVRNKLLGFKRYF